MDGWSTRRTLCYAQHFTRLKNFSSNNSVYHSCWTVQQWKSWQRIRLDKYNGKRTRVWCRCGRVPYTKEDMFTSSCCIAIKAELKSILNGMPFWANWQDYRYIGLPLPRRILAARKIWCGIKVRLRSCTKTPSGRQYSSLLFEYNACCILLVSVASDQHAANQHACSAWCLRYYKCARWLTLHMLSVERFEYVWALNPKHRWQVSFRCWWNWTTNPLTGNYQYSGCCQLVISPEHSWFLFLNIIIVSLLKVLSGQQAMSGMQCHYCYSFHIDVAV